MKNNIKPESSIEFIINDLERDGSKARIYTVEGSNKRVQVRLG